MRDAIRSAAAFRASSSISRAARPSATTSMRLGRYYRDYVELMAHFDAVLPGRVHRVFYERMVDDTEGEVRRLLDYCGLPFEEACTAFSRKPARGAHRKLRTGASADFSRRFGAMAALRPWLDPLKSALGPVLDRVSRHAGVLIPLRLSYTPRT